MSLTCAFDARHCNSSSSEPLSLIRARRQARHRYVDPRAPLKTEPRGTCAVEFRDGAWLGAAVLNPRRWAFGSDDPERHADFSGPTGHGK